MTSWPGSQAVLGSSRLPRDPVQNYGDHVWKKHVHIHTHAHASTHILTYAHT